ncbi:hypothetical protein FIBSPDRAFT_879925, partial [Athelia psychrophila]
MPLGALVVEKSRASGPDESRVLRLVFFNSSVRLLGLRSGMSTQDPRERAQCTDPQPDPSVGFTAAIVPLDQETHDVETDARPPCPF